MKKIISLICVSFITFSCSESLKKDFDFFGIFSSEEPPQATEEFVQGSEDIPLLTGMGKTSEDTVGFDSSSGSIISSSYASTISHKEVRNFYIKTLPQMGWQIVKNLENKVVFKRERENLEIEFDKENGKSVVRFFISSAL